MLYGGRTILERGSAKKILDDGEEEASETCAIYRRLQRRSARSENRNIMDHKAGPNFRVSKLP